MAAEAATTRQRDAWIQSAFIGWQTVGAMGGKTGSFHKYMKKLGIPDPRMELTPDQVKQEKETAFRNLEVVERAFDGGTA